MLSTRARETATTHSRPAPAQHAAAMAAPWICRQATEDRRCQGSEWNAPFIALRATKQTYTGAQMKGAHQHAQRRAGHLLIQAAFRLRNGRAHILQHAHGCAG